MAGVNLPKFHGEKVLIVKEQIITGGETSRKPIKAITTMDGINPSHIKIMGGVPIVLMANGVLKILKVTMGGDFILNLIL